MAWRSAGIGGTGSDGGRGAVVPGVSWRPSADAKPGRRAQAGSYADRPRAAASVRTFSVVPAGMTERQKTWSVPEVSPQLFLLHQSNDELGIAGVLLDQDLLAKRLMMREISWGYLRVCPGFYRIAHISRIPLSRALPMQRAQAPFARFIATGLKAALQERLMQCILVNPYRAPLPFSSMITASITGAAPPWTPSPTVRAQRLAGPATPQRLNLRQRQLGDRGNRGAIQCRLLQQPTRGLAGMFKAAYWIGSAPRGQGRRGSRNPTSPECTPLGSGSARAVPPYRAAEPIRRYSAPCAAHNASQVGHP